MGQTFPAGTNARMKFVRASLVLLAAAAAPLGAFAVRAESPARPQPQDAATVEAATANRTFGLALFRQLSGDPGNVVVSPISIAGAFGPVALGARGTTQAEIERTIGLPSAAGGAPGKQLGDLLRTLESDRDGARLSIATALWLMKDMPVKPAFTASARSAFDAEVETVDFRQSEAAAKRINSWVDRETKGRIRGIVKPSSLDATTALLVTNAVHFLGKWTMPFNASNTVLKPFHAGGASRDVPTMSGERNVRYAEDEKVQMIDLPYQGDRLSMTIVLPRERGGLAPVEQSLDGALLGQWFDRVDAATPKPVLIELPKVKTESDYSLAGPLKAMGIDAAFDPDRSDLRGIAERDLFISRVLHKTFLRIDEEGTEAAAVTSIEISVTGARIAPPLSFKADHPFLFFIRDRATGAVLFLGRIAAP